MFRQLRDAINGVLPFFPPNVLAASNAVLTGFRPYQLADYVEDFWAVAQIPGPVAAPSPYAVEHYVGDGITDVDRIAVSNTIAVDAPRPVPVINPADAWPHLIYAFVLENTKVVDVFGRVLHSYLNGETLPFATAATQRWLRATEELFFSGNRPLSVRSVTSLIRPDAGAVRRNAYYRLLGLDLNHGTQEGRSYPFHKADAANRDFPSLFEEFLREVWKAFMNRFNLIGPRATDPQAIRTLVIRIREMLNSRRYNGALSREEYDAVAMLSWFHLTLEYDTQIVVDLTAQAASPAERLRKIGARVGVPVHSRADAFFRMAEPLSTILIDIENTRIENNIGQLYLPFGIYQAQMLTIITQWSIATGRDIKEGVGIRGSLAPVGGPTMQPALPAPAGQQRVTLSPAREVTV